MIDIKDNSVDHKYINSRYNCNQIVYKLLERQEHIRDRINKGEIITPPTGLMGVAIEASRDTIDSVPYLTHQDFQKQIAELTDLVDYVTICISRGGSKGA